MSADLPAGKVFVDTNVLIYAYDIEAGSKHERCHEILHTLWKTKSGIISIQVMQEFFVNVTRKIPRPLSVAKSKGILQAYLAWQIPPTQADTVLLAVDIMARHQLSFWDAMIIASATKGGAKTLLSEGLSHDQLIEGVRVLNPFMAP